MKDLLKKPGYLMIVLIIGLGLTAFFFILPSVDLIKENQKAIAKDQSEINNIESKFESLKKFKIDSASTEEVNKKVNSLWPDDKGINDFILDLESLAQSENVTFTNLSISEPKTAAKKTSGSKTAKKTYPTISFSVESSGSYLQNLNVIKKLETFSRFNSINSVSVVTGENNLVTTKINGSIYYGK